MKDQDEEMSQTLGTAYHEAGHFVLAWMFDFDTGFVALANEREQLEGWVGALELPDYFDDSSLGKIEHYLMMTLAGGITERRFLPTSDIEGSSGDLACVDGWIHKTLSRLNRGQMKPGPAVSEYQQLLEKATLQLVEDANVWNVIEIVAITLAKEQRLNRRRLRLLMQGVSNALRPTRCPHCFAPEYDTSRFVSTENIGSVFPCHVCQRPVSHDSSVRITAIPINICRYCLAAHYDKKEGSLSSNQ